jgi:radical SAM protein with 4Fe4S-binding SPASM domain
VIADCFPGADLFARQCAEKVNRFSVDHKVPLQGHIDVTYRCNLRCIHCYVGDERQCAGHIAKELSTGEAREILNDAAHMGCLFLLISGGEPLCRPDFEEIYRSAKELGMVVTVYTNATLIEDRHVKLFRELPPRLVEISIYGATEETYEGVTGVPGSFDACMAGVERLHAGGVRVGLKTVMLQQNVGELTGIEGLAKRYDLPFRMDPIIVPELNGNKAPLLQRIEPETAAATEFSDERRAQLYLEHFRNSITVRGRKTLYQCNAGLVAFHVDPTGIVRPCFMERKIAYSAIEIGFKEAWRAVREVFSQMAVDFSSPGICEGCSERPLCGYCPGMFHLENGSYGRPPSYVCRIAALRKEKVLSLSQ